MDPKPEVVGVIAGLGGLDVTPRVWAISIKGDAGEVRPGSLTGWELKDERS
jgi:hypothetical protein